MGRRRWPAVAGLLNGAQGGVEGLRANGGRGVYAAMPLQAAVNLGCIAGGLWLAVVVWRHRGSWGGWSRSGSS